MKRLLLTFFLLPAWPVFADDSPLEEIIIIASPHNKTLEEIPGSVNSLSGEALQRELSVTLGGTLQNQLGIHSSSFGPGVGVPVIRGQSGKRVEVLQNHTVAGDVSDLSVDHAVAVDTLLADRIEILRGPAVLRYGPGAIGGVVNVIDNRIHTEAFEGSEGAVALRWNDNNDGQALSARFDAGSGRFVLHLGASSVDTADTEVPGRPAPDAPSGYVENTDVDIEIGNFGLSWIGDSVKAGLSLSRTDNIYGVPPGGHGHHEEHEEEEDDHDADDGAGTMMPDEDDHDEENDEEHGDEHDEEHGDVLTRIDMQQKHWEGRLQFIEPGEFLTNIDLELGYTDYEHRELEIEEGERHVGTLFELRSLELRSEMTHREMSGWRGAFGVQYSERDFEARGPEAFVPVSDTERLGIYILEEREFGDAVLELGLRWDRQKVSVRGVSDPKHNSFNISASLLAPLGIGQLGVTLSRSERAPVAEELLSEGEHAATNTYDLGDAKLDEEAALNLELKWTYSGAVEAQFSVYHNRFEDYIYQEDTELRFSHDLEEGGAGGLDACSDELKDFDDDQEEFEESPECFLYAQRDARFSGAEFEVEAPLRDNHSMRVWGDYVRARFSGGDDVPRIPPGRLGLGWRFAHQEWGANLDAVRVFAQNDPGENQSRTAGYARVDAGVNWRSEDLSLRLDVRNLGDRKIRNAASFLRDIAPEPGREVIASLTLKF